MPEPGYLTVALAASVAITVTLRAAPFGLKNAMNHSAAIAELGRWMPLGAITILAVYCLTTIDSSGATHGAPELTAVPVTVAIHLWRRNLVLSLITGTAVCLILTNWLLPA